MPEASNQDELIDLCIRGSEKAWKDFIKRFACLVRWAIKHKIVKSSLPLSEHDIDDIFQKTFADIWRNRRLEELKSARSVSSWLVITAQNATKDFAKSSRRFSARRAEEINDDIAHSPITPRIEADNRYLYRIIEDFILDLPIKERRIMTLALFYDLKHREIARITGISINTVSTIIARIKQVLKNRLKKRGYDV